MESKSTQPGKRIVPPFNTSLGKIGLAICYDLRFPEMALQLRRLGADVLTFPSAFTTRTGASHWELLLRSTAVQTQCYVIAAAQVGKHDPEGKRQSYGHAMVFSILAYGKYRSWILGAVSLHNVVMFLGKMEREFFALPILTWIDW
jgi:predicted amidohydrolase